MPCDLQIWDSGMIVARDYGEVGALRWSVVAGQIQPIAAPASTAPRVLVRAYEGVHKCPYWTPLRSVTQIYIFAFILGYTASPLRC